MELTHKRILNKLICCDVMFKTPYMVKVTIVCFFKHRMVKVTIVCFFKQRMVKVTIVCFLKHCMVKVTKSKYVH
jgi:hypothetical protein